MRQGERALTAPTLESPDPTNNRKDVNNTAETAKPLPGSMNHDTPSAPASTRGKGRQDTGLWLQTLPGPSQTPYPVPEGKEPGQTETVLSPSNCIKTTAITLKHINT